MRAAAGEASPTVRFTGIGSLPDEFGFSIDDRRFSPSLFQQRAVDMSPQIPYLAEAPGRGRGADMIGRTLAMSSAVSRDFSASLTTTGWRRSAPGKDIESATALLAADVDAFCAAIAGFDGVVKIQLAGPFTVAAMLEGSTGERMIADSGFVNDLAAVIAEAAAQLASTITRQSAVDKLLVQFDEPMLPQVIDGTLSTASGLRAHAAWPAADVTAILSHMLADLAHAAWLHCCAAKPPLSVLRDCGATGLSIDSRAIDAEALDVIGDAIDSDVDIVLGVLQPSQWTVPEAQLASAAAAAVDRLRQRLGFDEQIWNQRLVLSPSCGLAGASAAHARTVMAALHAASTSVSGGRISDDGA